MAASSVSVQGLETADTLHRGTTLVTSARHAFGWTALRNRRVQGTLLEDIADVKEAVANKRAVRVLFDDNSGDDGEMRVEDVILNDKVVVAEGTEPTSYVVEPQYSPQPESEVVFASSTDNPMLLNRQKTMTLNNDARSFMFWQNNPKGLYLPALLGKSGKSGEIARLIMKLDKNRDGYLSREEFRAAIEVGIKEVKKKAYIRKIIMFVVVLSVVILGACVGVTFTAVHYTKDFQSKDDGTVTRNGAPVQTDSTDFYVDGDGDEPATATRRAGEIQPPPALRSRTPINTTGLNMTKGKKYQVVITDPLRHNNQQVAAKRILRMTRKELSDLRTITIQTKAGKETVKVTGYDSSTNVDLEKNISTARLMFHTDQRVRPRLVFMEQYDMNLQTAKYMMSFPRVDQNGTDMNDFRRRLLSVESSANSRHPLFVGEMIDKGISLAISAIGEIMDGLGLSALVDQMIQGIIWVLGEVAKPIAQFIDWLPTSWEEVYTMMKSVLVSIFGDAASALTAELRNWVQIDSAGRICLSLLGGGTRPGSIDWESADGIFRAELTMPVERNCGGVQWNDIEIDQMKVKAFFDRIMSFNAIGEIISEVVHLIASTIPTLLSDWYMQFNNAFFDFVEWMFGSREIRLKIESFLSPIMPSQIYPNGRKRVRMMRRKLSAVVREVASDVKLGNRTMPKRLHLRHMLLHNDTDGPVREAFEAAIHKVAKRRMEATAREIFHVDNLRARAKADAAAGDTGKGGSHRRRKLLLLPSAQDVKNMFWFKTIPVSFDFSAEFAFTVGFPNFMFLREGDLMKDLGLPKLSISRIIPIFTTLSVEVIVDLDLVAPYRFLLISDEAEVEFRLLFEAMAVFDAADGSFTARIDTSRDKKTGVRMVKGSFIGHGQMGVDLKFGLGVGICLASFCISARGEMAWNVITMGFDTVGASATTLPGAGAANNMIASFNDYGALLKPPNKFIAYSADSIAAATQCANSAQREYILAGLYINAPWPKIKITIDTPIGQIAGGASPGGSINLMKWNWDEYDPNYVTTDLGATGIGLVSEKMSILKFLTTAGLQGLVTALLGATGPVGMFLVGGPINSLVLVDLTRRGAALFAEAVADLIPDSLQTGVIPDNIFTFTTDVVCFKDSLDFLFPKDTLQFVLPLSIPPLYEALIEAILPSRRNHTIADDEAKEVVRRWLSEDDVSDDDESEHWREACVHHGELCSDKSQCCDAHAICDHVDYHAFRVCTTPDGAYD